MVVKGMILSWFVFNSKSGYHRVDIGHMHYDFDWLLIMKINILC